MGLWKKRGNAVNHLGSSRLEYAPLVRPAAPRSMGPAPPAGAPRCARPAVVDSRTMRLLGACAAVLTTASGCWYSVEEYCAGCTRIEHTQIAVPTPVLGTHTQVVLVHGAFGFGAEWTPVVDWLRHTPGFDFFAWTWRGLGPFDRPPRDAQVLAAELQALLDRLPPSVREIIVLAHSAGGLLTNVAARQLRVAPGRQVTVALLDPALWPMLSLWPELARPEVYPKVPSGVTMTVYFARETPRPGDKLPPPEPVTATDLPQVYVGNVGHGPMVAKVALPLLVMRRGRVTVSAGP